MSGNFIVYLVGYVIAIIGVGYGLSAAGLASQWIIAIVLVMVGLGIVYALSRAQRDTTTRNASPPASNQTVINQDKPADSATRTTTTYERRE